MNNGVKILLVVANEGYQPIEYGMPKKVLEDAGYTVQTASDKKNTATGKDGSTAEVDVALDHVKVNDYAGIFFIGGPGALDHLDNDASYSIIKKAHQASKLIGAICIATRILAKAGVLTGKQATGWDGDNELGKIYQQHGVQYRHQDVVIDDNIITATGPAAAQEFGEQIITMLQNNKGWG